MLSGSLTGADNDRLSEYPGHQSRDAELPVVVASSNPFAAAAGAEVGRLGGNAVDACVAAGFALGVVEPLHCGVGGSGFMMVHSGRRSVLLDFYDDVPKSPRSLAGAPSVDLNRGEIYQHRIGPHSCAVPGTVAGLSFALQRFGTVALSTAVEGAVRLAEGGYETSQLTAHFAQHITAALRLAALSPRDYQAGVRLSMPGLGRFLRRIGAEGSSTLYGGVTAAAIARETHLTKDDLSSYTVVEREPLRFAFAGHSVVSNPAPSMGGERMRKVLEDLIPDSSAEELAAAVQGTSSAWDVTGGHTSHVSCLDTDGNAAALTVSLGVGCGVRVPGTEVMLNNALGEPGTSQRGRSPGRRLSSFMAPTLVLDGQDRVKMVLGSPGSARIPSALAQVLFRRLLLGQEPEEAIRAPRVHATPSHLYAEPGAFVRPGNGTIIPPRLDSFFGGVNLVERFENGTLRGFTDPRRGGAVACG